MTFQNEQQALAAAADFITKSAANLFYTTKYIYALSENRFYSCDIQDIFKVFLNNITNADALKVFRLRIDGPECSAVNSPAYNHVLALMVYSLVIRLPALKNVKICGEYLSSRQIKALMDELIAKGAENYDNIIPETPEETETLVKKGKMLPPYSADWYKTFLYRNTPELAEISNRSVFLQGAADLLFPMFYVCLETQLVRLLEESAAKSSVR